MMNKTARKWFGAVAAAATISLVSSVAPADAAHHPAQHHRTVLAKKMLDSGWDRP